jgi:hypothetical protein
MDIPHASPIFNSTMLLTHKLWFYLGLNILFNVTENKNPDDDFILLSPFGILSVENKPNNLQSLLSLLSLFSTVENNNTKFYFSNI